MGREQAASLAERLAGEGIEAVHTSPVDRAVETAQAIAAAAGISAETVEWLNEIDFGAWTGRRFADLNGDPQWDRWNGERSVALPPGGESMAQAQHRVMFHLYGAAGITSGTVVLVTHCDIIRAAVAAVIGLSLDHLLRFEVDVASITRLEVTDGHARLITLNERTF